MDMLIPLSRFEVTYEVGSGRPYSELDQLVLRAVAGGASTIEHLCTIFRLPKRLLIEVIVTLARAGWVAVDVAEGGFKATASGNEAAETGEIPPFCILRNAQAVVVMERVTGSLISERGDISYTNSFTLKQSGEWEGMVRLSADYTEDRLDAGQVDRLLRTEQGEWIHSVDTPVLISRGRHWLPVSVDLEKQKVHRLPEQWQKELAPLLLAKAARKTVPVRLDMGTTKIETATTAVEVNMTAEDVLSDAAAHHNALKSALSHAQTTVVIASAFLDIKAIEGELKTLIMAAVKRGVQVNLLWGYAVGGNSETKVAMRWLREIRREAGVGSALLRFNGQPTESHAKLLIYDSPQGQVAYVGSCNWLSTPLGSVPNDFVGSNVSIRLTHPALVASLYRTAASFWLTSRGGQMSEIPERLRRIASSLEEKNQLSPKGKPASANKCFVQLVRDREHTALFRDIQLYETGRILVTSHKLSDVAATRFASRKPFNESAQPMLVHYGESLLGNDDLNSLAASSAKVGIQLSHVPKLHSKLLATKGRAIVSSFNFLSADPFGVDAHSREVGVLIEGGPLPALLRDLAIGRKPSGISEAF